MATCVLLSFVLILAGSVDSLNDPYLPNIFFPFGADEGDRIVPVSDDGSSPELRITGGFPFFGVRRNTVYVYSDGLISFGASVHHLHTPRPLPVSNPSTPFIAPYWADVDTRTNNGRIYYRTVTGGALTVVSRDVQSICSSFKARWALIVTWHNVTFLGVTRTPPPINTFQAVLTTNGRMSMVLFHYGSLSWTSGTLSGGDPSSGLGGNAALVGFNNGDGVNYYSHPSSLTDNIRNVVRLQSNVAVAGRWVYRLDRLNITSSPPCHLESSAVDITSPSTVRTTVVELTMNLSNASTLTSASSPSSVLVQPVDHYLLALVVAVVSAVLLGVLIGIIVTIVVCCRKFKIVPRRSGERLDSVSCTSFPAAVSETTHDIDIDIDTDVRYVGDPSVTLPSTNQCDSSASSRLESDSVSLNQIEPYYLTILPDEPYEVLDHNRTPNRGYDRLVFQ